MILMQHGAMFKMLKIAQIAWHVGSRVFDTRIYTTSVWVEVPSNCGDIECYDLA